MKRSQDWAPTAIKVDNLDELLFQLNLTENQSILIGIDGRPCSGKSTSADLLIEALQAEGLFLDDFFIPQTEWPPDIGPAFPFPYFRYQEFTEGLCNLAKGKLFKYQPYDWSINKLGKTWVIDPKNIVIVEGVSILCKQLLPCFHKKILVVSDQVSEFEAIRKRENNNIALWNELYLPSVDIYWRTSPWKNADVLYAGRGITNKESIGQFVY